MRIIVIQGSEIINIADPFPTNNPEPGWQPDGTYVIYLEDLEGLSPSKFIQYRFWDGTSLQSRPARPSTFCEWNGTEWAVNAPVYLRQIRYERDLLLYRTDWTQLADAPLTQEQIQEALTYRQALRDMIAPILANPSAYIRIEDAPWPIRPSFINAN